MPLPKLRGVFTALVTPFRDGALDEAAFVKLVERQIAGGVHGLVPVGTTGETATLSHDEHRRVVELAVQTAAGRVPVIAGAGSNSTPRRSSSPSTPRRSGPTRCWPSPATTTGRARRASTATSRRWTRRSTSRSSSTTCPRGPSSTSPTSSSSGSPSCRTLSASRTPPATWRGASLQRLACGADWLLLSGDDPSALGYMAHGGHGCISVTSNVAPEACAAFFNACLAGDWESARDWQGRLIRLHKGLFLDASPSPTKFALAAAGALLRRDAPADRALRRGGEAGVLAAMREAGLEPSSIDAEADRREPPRAVRLLPGREARGGPACSPAPR